MVKKEIGHLSLAQIAESGQVFRIREKIPGIWAVTAGSHYVEITQSGSEFVFSCEEPEFEQVWTGYFNLDLDYGEVKGLVSGRDSYLKEACAYGWGIRILRQDLWEMIVTFLISQNNNMVRIGNNVEALCDKFGEKLEGRGFSKAGEMLHEVTVSYRGFPSPEAIAFKGFEGLAGLGLGYRDKYLYEMAVWCSGQEGKAWLTGLTECDYATAHEMLTSRYGVGKKVADCICLFGLHHVGAFPVDTHMKQILASHYPKGFPVKRYGSVAGILQQYMFYHKVKEKV